MTHVDVSQAIYALDVVVAGQVASADLPAPGVLDREEWPPDYAGVLAWRQQQLTRFEADPDLLEAARAWYTGEDVVSGNVEELAHRCSSWITHWVDTYDPRNAGKPDKSARMPLVLFRRQAEFVHFIMACMDADATGLVEKSRDMGASWVGLAVSAWLWIFSPGAAIGWGANKLDLVDKIGDPDTLFEKLRSLIRQLPECFRPNVLDGVHLKHTVCVNPENGAVVSGQGGIHIGRGGRRRLYFVDEAAHLDKAEAVEASLSENTRCRIDLSSVSGPGTVFYRKRMAGVEWEPGKPVRRDVVNVFILDWSDHPEKTTAWHAERVAYYTAQGTPAVVAREIDRDYAGAAEGIVIAHEWALAAIDAHVRLGFDDSGGWHGGLDCADEGPDVHALVRMKGRVVRYAEEMTDRDPGVVARRAFRMCHETSPIDLEWDSGGGFGGTVKSEFNRISQDEGVDMRWLTLTPWSAGDAVRDPHKRIFTLPDGRPDENSPLNKDFFHNFKAQAWWNVGRRFYKTWRMIRALDGCEPADYPTEDLIALDSTTIPKATLVKLCRELSQATMGQSSSLKMLINKAPDGAKSPNLADGLIMADYPAPRAPKQMTSMFGPKVFTG